MDQNFQALAVQLIDAGRVLAARGLVPATSGNFSCRLINGDLAITCSGADKGALALDDIMRTDATGESYDTRIPSAETLLHVQIYRHFPRANAVLHVHSLNATVLSRLQPQGVQLSNYELLKALPGINSHEACIDIPVFGNDQQIPRLAQAVEKYMSEHNTPPAYLIAGHGVYTWGDDIAQSMKCVEALEFLFACELLARRA